MLKNLFQKIWQWLKFLFSIEPDKSFFDPDKNFLQLKIVHWTIIIPFIFAIIITLLVGVPFIIKFLDTGNFYAVFNSQSWNRLLFDTFKSPISILVALIPFVALLAAAHRSEQTKTQIEKTNIQIEKTNIQIEKTNIQMKQNEYFKGLDNLAEDSLMKIEVGVRQLTALKNLTTEQKEAIKTAFIQRLKNPLTKIIKTNKEGIKGEQITYIVFFNYGEPILDWLATNGNIKDGELDNANFDYQKFSKNTNFSIFKQSRNHLSFFGARLINADLNRANLRYANLSGANLKGAKLYDAKLSGADLSDADLSDADLNRVDLSSTSLSGVKLNKAKLIGVDLRGVKLSGADLNNTDLNGADLGNADLREVDLRNANLINAKLNYADLNEAKLNYANFSGADLSNAKLFNAKFSNAKFSQTEFSKDAIEKYGIQLTEEQKKGINWI